MTSDGVDTPGPAGPLAGRAVLVVGASSGIGAATAHAVAGAGARVGVLARRRDRLPTPIRRAGGRCSTSTSPVCSRRRARRCRGWGRAARGLPPHVVVVEYAVQSVRQLGYR